MSSRRRILLAFLCFSALLVCSNLPGMADPAVPASEAAAIDRETGILISYLRLGDMSLPRPRGDPPAVSQEEALRRAREFLERVGVEPRAPWVLTEARYQDAGTIAFYTFLWRKYFHGLRLPAWIDVVIDADSGEVESYILQDDPVLVPLTPRVGAAEAIKRVAEHQGYRRWIVRKVELIVSYEPPYPGPQVLAWWIELINPDARTLSESEVLARVNAQTGVVISAAMPASASPIDPDSRSRLAEKAAANDDALPKLDLEAIAKGPIPPTIFELAQRKGTRRRR